VIHLLNDKISDEIVKPFDDEVLEFTHKLSLELLSKKYKEFPELIALGFWLRDAHIKKLEQKFIKSTQDKLIQARGVVFHIAPNNVDTIFLYSLLLSMFVGNSNIVRVSQNITPQMQMLLDILTKTITTYKNVSKKMMIVSYGHDDKITTKFSMMCDVRVIWGGDNTISHIRKLPLKATSTELLFANKFSLLAIKLKDKDEVTNNFLEKCYRDSITFMQQACSSVKAICWIDTTQNLQDIFWEKFLKFIEEKETIFDEKGSVDKLMAEIKLALNHNVSIKNENNIFKVKLPNIKALESKSHCGLGLFYEVDLQTLDELLDKVDRGHQTLSVYGFTKEDIKKSFQTSKPKGIDRVVSLGKAMEFSPIWDGYDMMQSLCRVIDVDI